MHLTPQQLAARWHVSEKTLERWRNQGTGPAFLKIVGRVLYPTQHIDAIEAKRTRLATSKPLPEGADLSEAEQRIAERHGCRGNADLPEKFPCPAGINL